MGFFDYLRFIIKTVRTRNRDKDCFLSLALRLFINLLPRMVVVHHVAWQRLKSATSLSCGHFTAQHL